MARSADKEGMRQASIPRDELRPAGIPWALQMKAVSRQEPDRLETSLTGAILGCGGWVLRQTFSDTGLIDMVFEFERHLCLDVYSILVAAGLELSQAAHLRFTELWQCTRFAPKNCGEEIVSVELRVQTFPSLSDRTMAT